MDQYEDFLNLIGRDIDDIRSDRNADKEQKEFKGKAYDKNTYSALLEANERRDEKTREHFHIIFLGFLWVIGLSLISIVVVRILHTVLPDYCHWLSTDSIQDIDRMLFSGTIGGLILKYLEPTLRR